MPGGNYIKSVDENVINRTISFENYTREDMTDILQFLKKGSNFHADNPFLEGKYTEEQLKNISSTIQKYFSPNAINGREDALPFVSCALLAKGYSMEEIVGNKVDKSAFDEIYNNIMDMNNPEKNGKAMEWAYNSFAKGMHKAVSTFESKFDDRSFKSADTWMNGVNHLLSSTILIGSCNYFEGHGNDNFRNELRKVSEREGLTHNNEIFDIEKAYNKTGPKVSKFSGTRITHFLEALSAPEKDADEIMHEVGLFYNLANMAPETPEDAVFGNMNVMRNLGNQEVGAWFNDLGKRPGASDFIYDCIKTGKFFSSISIKGFDEDKGCYTYNINADAKELEEAYMDFSKNLDTNILKRDFSEAITNDRKANSVTYEEVEETRRLSNNYSKASGVLDDIASTRARAIYSLSTSYSSLKNPTQKDLDRLTNLTRVISPIVEEALDKRGVSVRSMATELSEDDFVFGSEKGEDEKPLSETQMWEYQKKCNDLLKFNPVKNSLDIKDDYDIEGRINKGLESFKKTHEGAEKLSKSELMDSFVNEQKEAVVELSQSETYRKVYHTPESPNTNKVITDKFRDFMEQLEDTSEKDEQGMLKGNTELFTKMYESVKAVAEYEGNNRALPKGQGLHDLLNKAQENIENYIKERDTFFKFTKKGRDRLDIAKNMKMTTDIYNDEYGKLCEDLVNNHKNTVKDAVCKAPEIKEMMAAKPTKTVQREKTSEKTLGQKDPEKKSFSKEGF